MKPIVKTWLATGAILATFWAGVAGLAVLMGAPKKVCIIHSEESPGRCVAWRYR